MKLRTTFYLAILLVSGLSLTAQDIHFSNYNYAPLFINPANTGAFSGTYRAGANYRTQFYTFFDNPYVSTSAYFDSPVTFVIKDKAWVGVGLMISQDQVGDIGMRNTGVMGNAAFHYALDPKFKSVISLGAQYGRITHGSNVKRFEPGSGQGQNDLDYTLVMSDNFSPGYNDVSIGLRFKQEMSKTSDLIVGAAFQHITSPRYSFTNSPITNRIGRRLNVHGQYILNPSDRMTWKPGFFFSASEGFTNTILQVLGEYQVNKKSTSRVNYGLGYRMGDAAIITMGFIFKGWNFAFNYDLTLSSASAYNNNTGGIELGVFKIFTINKKPKVKIKEICPRL